MSNPQLPPLESYTIPQETFAAIYLIHEPTRSVLLFGDRVTGLTGYVYKDSTGSMTIKSESVKHLYETTGIQAEENGLQCTDILEEVTGENEEKKSSWTFIVIIKKFSVSRATPENAKWYNFNTIPWGKIKSKKERVFLRNAVQESR